MMKLPAVGLVRAVTRSAGWSQVASVGSLWLPASSGVKLCAK